MFGLDKSINNLTAALREATEQRATEFKWLKSHFEFATKQDLKEMEKRILMTQAELSTALDKLTSQTGKIAQEQSDRFDKLSAEIKKLTDIINAGGDVTPQVTEALAKTQTALDNLDAAIPDAPEPA
jgi:chromosome segregation ATPase